MTMTVVTPAMKWIAHIIPVPLNNSRVARLTDVFHFTGDVTMIMTVETVMTAMNTCVVMSLVHLVSTGVLMAGASP
jgi:hypothetical protein